MVNRYVALSLSFVALASQAQTLTPPCNIPAANIPSNAVTITTSGGQDMGAAIVRAVSQAIANGSNAVVINPGSDGAAPFYTKAQLNNVSNVTIKMNPGVAFYGYGVNDALFLINGGSNVKILGGSINGNGAGTCVSVVGNANNPANTIEVGGVECFNTVADGVSVNSQGTLGNAVLPIQNVSIHDSYIHDTGSTNIAALGVTNLCMQGNKLRNPAVGGLSGSGQPVNVGITLAENVYFGQNDVSGTPNFFRQPNAVNTPPSGFYSFASSNVNTENNTFHDSQCTLATCSSASDLPASPFGIHHDTVLNSLNVNNVVSGYGPGITCELSWNCSVTGGSIHDVYAYGLYDESNYSERQLNSLTSVNGLVARLAGTQLTTVNDVVNGSPTSVVQAAFPTTGYIFFQDFGGTIDYSVLPFTKVWVKSANGQPAGGLEVWLYSGTDFSATPHTRLALPALQAGQWTQVTLAPSHIAVQGTLGARSWALVNPGNHASDTVEISDLRQFADSRNNTYTGIDIARTGAYPLAVSGCGNNTNFNGNTVTDPGTTGFWPYTNSGLLAQVFIGGYNNCNRTNVNFNGNTEYLNSSNIPLGGSSLLNLSNYGSFNSITNVSMRNNVIAGPYASVPKPFVVNNQGGNSTIATPTFTY